MLQKFKKHQFLFEELVKRDFKKKYKGTMLGMGWSILSPLLMLLVMKLVFTQLFGRNIEHYTIYIFCGNIVFTYFSDASSQGMSSLLGNSSIFTKVNIPKYMFVFSKNIQCLINFGLIFCIFVVFCIFDGIIFTWRWIMLIYPFLLLVLFNLGVGLILSALYVFFRDFYYLWNVFLRLLMYVSAIFYTVESYDPSIQKVFFINPIYSFITYFRTIVIDTAVPAMWIHLLLLFYTVVVLFVGCKMYQKYNHKFLYYV